MPAADGVTVATFHALGLAILREHPAEAGLPDGFRVADEAERAAARARPATTRSATASCCAPPSWWTWTSWSPRRWRCCGSGRSWLDRYRARWPWVFVDEYQDVDADQYALLRLLVPPDGNLCAIGDPDQAIYSFRGADVGFFLRFAEDFTDARMVRLTRNYRSAPPIIAAALQAIAPTTLVPRPAAGPGPAGAGGAAARPLPGRLRRGRGRLRRAYRGRPGGRGVAPLAGLGAGWTPGRRPRRSSFSDIAVLYRTDAQAGPDRGRADPGRNPGAETVARPAAGPRRRTELAAELRLAGPGGGDLRARVKRAGQALVDRYHAPVLDPAERSGGPPGRHLGRGGAAHPAGGALRRRPARFLAALAAGQRWTRWTPGRRRSPC